MYSIVMKIKNYSSDNTITAIAMVLSKSALVQNISDQSTICLKVFLGQKQLLITDNNKFSLTEIIPMNAAGNLAIMISESINTTDQIKFTAKITNDNKGHSLALLKIEKQNNG
jgi:hypothetical protein